MREKTKNIIVVILLAAVLLTFSLWCWLRETDDFSDSERRVLASFPELSVETLLSGDFMAKFEDYSLDQFPLRDKMRQLKAVTEFNLFLRRDNNDIFLADGHVSKLEYPMSEAMLDNAAAKFQYLYDTYMAGKDMDIYLSIVPDKNAFLAKSNGYLSLDYDKFIETFRSKVDYMEYIDITDLLSADDYYYTDSHWRQENLLDIAQRIAGQMGVTLSAEYTENILDIPFYGVYCGQSALNLKPDTIKYLTNDILDNCIVTSYDTGKPVEKSVYNMEKAAGKDTYELFMSGTDALLVAENPTAETDRELIIFRDSFGSSLAPLLMEGYAKVTLVDIRYVHSAMLGNLIEFENQDVLFLYSTTLLNNSLAFK